MQENPIDKIFREKLKRPSDIYNPQHWDQAQILISKFRRNRKNRNLILALLLVLFGIALAVLLYFQFHNEPTGPIRPEKTSDIPLATVDNAGHESQKDNNKPFHNEQPGSRPSLPEGQPGENIDSRVQVESALRNTEALYDKSPGVSHLERSGNPEKPVSKTWQGIASEIREGHDLAALPVLSIHPVPGVSIASPNIFTPGSLISATSSVNLHMAWSGTLMLNPDPVGNNQLKGIQLGFAVEYPMSRQWIVGVRPHFHLTINESGFSKFDEQISFGFGSETTTYGLQAESLQFVSLPVYLGWKHSKHQIELGGGLNILLAARGQLQKIDLISNHATSLLELQRGWIETKEMQTMSFSLFLGYKLQITDKLRTGFSLFYSPEQIYPGFPNSIPQNYRTKWHFGLQTNYYFK